ncbi:MAG: barstar family protein [Candidatus Ventricola sp.]
MKTIKLDVTNISTVKALHVYLAYVLDLPAYYGRNLDALHDVLGEICEQTRIVLTGRPASGEMAAYLPRLARVLEDAAQENPALHLGRDEGMKAQN